MQKKFANADTRMASSIVDVVVVGSGAAGLATALTAKVKGLSVIVLEKDDVYGGTSAISGGELWIPCNQDASALGRLDSHADAMSYLRASCGSQLNERRAQCFIESASEAIQFFREKSAAEFELNTDVVDYYPHLPGAKKGTRTLRTVPFDGRNLGADFRRLKLPLAAGQIFGGLSLSREDIPHFTAMSRSLTSFRHVLSLLIRHVFHRASGLHRGARTTMGNALIARLAFTLNELKVPIVLGSSVTKLIHSDEKIVGVECQTSDGQKTRYLADAVVFACGGFPGNLEMRKDYFPHVHRGHTHYTLAPEGNTGDGIRMAADSGAQLSEPGLNPAAWTPASLWQRTASTKVVVPHFSDRSKPGMIIIDASGRRFVNEGLSYHDFVLRLIDRCSREPETFAYLIADHRSIRKYGFGRVAAFPASIRGHVRSGYVKRGRTLRELAVQIDVSEQALEKTVMEFNADALLGVDALFEKGKSDFDKSLGDPINTPNACLAPIVDGPFYAIKLFACDIGTLLGIKTDESSRAISAGQVPIEGLYVVGNDTESIFAGGYPAAGITLGPALTFGYRIGTHLSQVLNRSSRSTA